MKPEFTMSMYRNKEDLYKDKAEYYEKAFLLQCKRLAEIEELSFYTERDEYYCTSSGEGISEIIKEGL